MDLAHQVRPLLRILPLTRHANSSGGASRLTSAANEMHGDLKKKKKLEYLRLDSFFYISVCASDYT